MFMDLISISLYIQNGGCDRPLLKFRLLIATNQRVVAATRQQRGLVAVTIRSSVLFYSSAIRRPDFHSV